MRTIGESIPEAPTVTGQAEVTAVNYDRVNLTISVTDDEKRSILVVFQNPAGFKVLDERDLLEYWPSCSSPNGWAFRIIEGGWFEQECEREGFLTSPLQDGMKEYFFAGLSDCVSVLSKDGSQFICT